MENCRNLKIDSKYGQKQPYFGRPVSHFFRGPGGRFRLEDCRWLWDRMAGRRLVRLEPGLRRFSNSCEVLRSVQCGVFLRKTPLRGCGSALYQLENRYKQGGEDWRRCDILLWMRITLAHIGTRAGSKDGLEPLIQSYLERCSALARCRTEGFRTEEAMLEWLERQQGRTPALAVLLDGRGRQMSSEDLARWVGARRDEGAQHLVFAVGPASGWSDAARKRALLLLSLGPMTLAHALARLVMAEQIYRAFTILTGHPYHAGH
jgi:23S rRNA (pseudouridine1915-N3)-methyltransferase